MANIEQVSKTTSSMSGWNHFLLVTILALIIVALMASSVIIENNTTNYFTSMIQAMSHWQLESIKGHLRLEKVLVGGQDADISLVWSHFDNAELHATNILDGIAHLKGDIVPFKNATLDYELLKMQESFAAFRTVAEIRWNEEDSPGPGTGLGPELEILFAAVLQQAHLVEESLFGAVKKWQKQILIIQGILGLVALVLISLIGLVLRNQERQKIHDKLTIRGSEEQNLRLSHVLESSLNEIYLFDQEDFHFIEANQAARDNLGYPMDELVNLTPLTINPKINHEQFVALVEPLLAGEKDLIQFKTKHERKDGSLYPVDVHLQLTAGDRPVFLEIIIDTSELDEARDEIQERKVFLEAILEHIEDGVIACDANGVLTFSNRAAEIFHGQEIKNLSPEKWSEHFDLFEADGETPLKQERIPLFRALKGEAVSGQEIFIAPLNQPPRTLLATGSRLSGAGDDLLGAVVSLHDISSKKFTEESLVKSERMHREAQTIAQMGHWELDLVSNELIWSDEIFRIFHLKPQEFEATYEAFLMNIHPDDREAVNTAYTNSLQKKQPYEIVHRLLLDDGTLKYVQEKCQTTFAADGTPLVSTGTVQDVTTRILAEKELHKYRLQLEDMVETRTAELLVANKDLEDFAYSVSHDLKAPLRAISGFSEIISRRHRDSLNEESKKYFDHIMTAGQNMNRLIEDLLKYSRLGRQSLELQPVALRDVFSVIEATFGSRVKELGGCLVIPGGDLLFMVT
jgi:PAS domain S-box-containing protein